MISPAAAELIRRAKEQVRNGIAHVQSGEPLIAEVWLRAGVASLDALEALLDEPLQKPLRKLVVVGRQAESMLGWPHRAGHDEDPDGAS